MTSKYKTCTLCGPCDFLKEGSIELECIARFYCKHQLDVMEYAKNGNMDTDLFKPKFSIGEAVMVTKQQDDDAPGPGKRGIIIDIPVCGGDTYCVLFNDWTEGHNCSGLFGGDLTSHGYFMEEEFINIFRNGAALEY